MTKKIIWIATSNSGKVEEYKRLLGNQYQVKTLFDLSNYKDIEETGTTFEENALIKAKDLALFTNGIALGDDSGLCVDALNGFPGIYSKRWCHPITGDDKISQALLDKLAMERPNQDYKAHMNTSIAYYDATTNTEKVFTGIVQGVLSKTVIQTIDGFGYDNIFIPDGFGITYSLLGTAEKIKSSARTIALNKLLNWIK